MYICDVIMMSQTKINKMKTSKVLVAEKFINNTLHQKGINTGSFEKGLPKYRVTVTTTDDTNVIVSVNLNIGDENSATWRNVVKYTQENNKVNDTYLNHITMAIISYIKNN